MRKRCEVVPLPNQQFQFRIDGREVTRWHHGADYPRPFFYPAIVASGESLTRMGHPGAPNHDHHRSIWFAHHKVFGRDFWSDVTETRIRQTEWLAIHEADDCSRFGCMLAWLDGHDPQPLMSQQLLLELRPGENRSWTLELQSTFEPATEELELQATNFGFLAVRVSRQIAEHWGGGTLTSSERKTSEPNLFGQPARWMDYSGTQYAFDQQAEVAEGITYLDHPDNVGQPTRWHVREDGWMGAAPGMKAAIPLRKSSPLVLRYLLHFHEGQLEPEKADQLHDEFARLKPLKVGRSRQKHQHLEIQRSSA